MMRAAVLLALALGATPLPAAPAGDADCAARLAATLAVMEARAPLKDEVATALMWMRLDAEAALAAGDEAACRAQVAVVEGVLLMEPGTDG